MRGLLLGRSCITSVLKDGINELRNASISLRASASSEYGLKGPHHQLRWSIVH